MWCPLDGYESSNAGAHPRASARRVLRIVRFAVAGMKQHYCSGIVVRERGRKTAVGLGLGKQRVGLGLKCLHGVGARSEAGGRLLERGQLDQSVGESSGVAALLPIHALPSRDDFLRLL